MGIRKKTLCAGVMLAGLTMVGLQQAAAQDYALYGRPMATSYVAPAGVASAVAQESPSDAAVPAAVPVPQAADKSSACTGGDNCCCSACCNPCGPAGRFWVRAEYLRWWTKGSRIPALVADGDLNTLYGDREFNGKDHSGFRVTMGVFLDPCREWALEGDYFDLTPRDTSYDSGFSNGQPTIIVRPFFNSNANVNALDGELVSFPTGPNALTGSVTVETSDYFQSAGLGLRKALYCCNQSCGDDLETIWCNKSANSVRVDAIGGYRFFRLTDSILIHERLVNTGDDPGRTFDVQDYFKASNEFNGIDLGMAFQVIRGRWQFDAIGKTAFGNNRQIVNIRGQTVSVAPSDGTVTTTDGGLLAQGPNPNTTYTGNAGHYTRDRFCALPSLTLQVGYQVTPHLRTFVGYDVLYWDRVLRAGEQIDFAVDSANIPPRTAGGGSHPAFEYREASFWAHGMNVGAEVRY